MFTHAQDYVDIINKIWVGCEKQVKNVSLSIEWTRIKISAGQLHSDFFVIKKF